MRPKGADRMKPPDASRAAFLIVHGPFKWSISDQVREWFEK
jgi:hypothetical protein